MRVDSVETKSKPRFNTVVELKLVYVLPYYIYIFLKRSKINFEFSVEYISFCFKYVYIVPLS